jgi:hypothetical protein
MSNFKTVNNLAEEAVNEISELTLQIRKWEEAIYD